MVILLSDVFISFSHEISVYNSNRFVSSLLGTEWEKNSVLAKNTADFDGTFRGITGRRKLENVCMEVWWPLTVYMCAENVIKHGVSICI